MKRKRQTDFRPGDTVEIRDMRRRTVLQYSYGDYGAWVVKPEVDDSSRFNEDAMRFIRRGGMGRTIECDSELGSPDRALIDTMITAALHNAPEETDEG